MHRFVSSLFVCLILAGFSVAQQPAAQHAKPAAKPAAVSGLPSEEAVNAFMQSTFGYEPTLTWKINGIRPAKAQGLAEVSVIVSGAQGQQQMNIFYVTPDGQHAVVGDIIPFGAHPFAATRKELEKKAAGPSRGPANAPVTIVEFSDLQCPHCKQAQPEIEKLLSEEPNTRLVFENFPLPMHDWAEKAAGYADCIGRRSPDSFWKFMQGVYDSQADITMGTADEKLSDLADKAGAKGSEIAICAAQDETIGRVQASIALGKSLEVTGTPAFFINGRRIADFGSLPYDILKKLVEFAAKGGM